MCGCLSCAPLLGTWLPTQACAVTGNRTGDPLVCSPALNPLSHTSQGISSQVLLHKDFQNSKHVYTFWNEQNTNASLKLLIRSSDYTNQLIYWTGVTCEFKNLAVALAGGSVCWNIIPHTKRLQVHFPIRAHTQLRVQSPVGAHMGGNQLMFFSHINTPPSTFLSLFLFFSKINKIIFLSED